MRVYCSSSACCLILASAHPMLLLARTATTAVSTDRCADCHRCVFACAALMLYCPEGAKPALLMMYATAKAALVDRLEGLGIKPDSSVGAIASCYVSNCELNVCYCGL